MSEKDTEYLQHRAEQEVQRAQQATKPEVVAAHYALSELYFQRIAREASRDDGAGASALKPEQNSNKQADMQSAVPSASTPVN